jgi:hypothetical protein
LSVKLLLESPVLGVAREIYMCLLCLRVDTTFTGSRTLPALRYPMHPCTSSAPNHDPAMIDMAVYPCLLAGPLLVRPSSLSHSLGRSLQVGLQAQAMKRCWGRWLAAFQVYCPKRISGQPTCMQPGKGSGRRVGFVTCRSSQSCSLDS